MTLPSPSLETHERVWKAAGVDEKILNEAVDSIQTWLDKQPHLPNVQSRNTLQLLYLQCKRRMHKVQKSLDLYYSMKNTIPEVFCGRDPHDPFFKYISSRGYYYLPLPRLTDDLCRVTVAGLMAPDQDANKFPVYDVIKFCTLTQELRYLQEFTPFDIYVVDFTNVTLSHVTSFTFPVLKKFADITLKGYRVLIKSIHFVNAPLYVDVLVALLRIVLKPKIYNKIHVHRNGLGNLHQFVPKRILPVEFGGEDGSIIDLKSAWEKKVLSNREWFLEQEQYKADESKRQKKK